MIKAVLFDYFGVICSDEYWQFVKAERQAASVFREFSNEVNLGNLHWQTFVNKVAKATGQSESDVNEMYASEKVNPDVVALIIELKKNYKIGLITNAHHEFIDKILKDNHLGNLLDVEAVSSRLGVTKPDPRIFQFALAKLGINPEEAVYIDDLEIHVKAARTLGMQAIWYKNLDQLKSKLDILLADSKN